MDVFVGIDAKVLYPSNEAIGTSLDSIILPVHDNSWNDSIGIIKFPCKPWNERSDYPYLKFLVPLYC
jgi:hypothetical protein